MHELVDELAQERLERVRRHQLVARRRRGGEKTRDVRLVGLHVPLQKRIQVEQMQPVQTDDAREHTRRAGIAPVEEKSGLLEEEDEEDEDGDLNEWPEEWEDVDGSAAS